MSTELSIETTEIPGFLVINLPVHGDDRGWFKENWQREKMVSLGLPDFAPVQNNISYNAEPGVTRGIHAEPWDKFISVGNGKIFGAWVDLREGDSFGKTFSLEMDQSKAVYVPRGVGNAFQALEPNTVYTYLVNDHWSANAEYSSLSLADETANIKWPIPLEKAELSDKDKAHPRLAKASPVKARKTLITGANGQLGTALHVLYPDAEFVDHEEFDITNFASYLDRHWKDYGVIINAAAYTNVDGAEGAEGRTAAWKVNADAVRLLTKTASENGITLVHISTDYVFDGTQSPHSEEEAFAPLSVYGASKAAGDLAAATAPKHYILRTSWVVGEGENFVKTMYSLAKKDVKPSVVADQIGRLTFSTDLADAIKHLLDTNAQYGTYNVSNEGEPASWAAIAREVFEAAGKSSDDVTDTTTADYYQGKEGVAPRPLQSTLDLDKIKAVGFEPRSWKDALHEYMQKLQEES